MLYLSGYINRDQSSICVVKLGVSFSKLRVSNKMGEACVWHASPGDQEWPVAEAASVRVLGLFLWSNEVKI